MSTALQRNKRLELSSKACGGLTWIGNLKIDRFMDGCKVECGTIDFGRKGRS